MFLVLIIRSKIAFKVLFVRWDGNIVDSRIFDDQRSQSIQWYRCCRLRCCRLLYQRLWQGDDLTKAKYFL